AAATKASTSAPRLTSARYAATSAPRACSSRSRAASAASCTSTSSNLAPSRASTFAVALPMAPAAPVTMMLLPASVPISTSAEQRGDVMAVHVFADAPHEAVLQFEGPGVVVVVDAAVGQLANGPRLAHDVVAVGQDAVHCGLRVPRREHATHGCQEFIDDHIARMVHARAGNVLHHRAPFGIRMQWGANRIQLATGEDAEEIEGVLFLR